MPFTNQLRVDAFANALNVSAVRSFSGDNQLAITQAIANGTTNQEILAAIDVSATKFVVLSSDVALTLKTNSSGSPDNTINLSAGVPYIWGYGDYNSLLLTVDVAKFFVTNSSGSSATLNILALIDLP